MFPPPRIYGLTAVMLATAPISLFQSPAWQKPISASDLIVLRQKCAMLVEGSYKYYGHCMKNHCIPASSYTAFPFPEKSSSLVLTPKTSPDSEADSPSKAILAFISAHGSSASLIQKRKMKQAPRQRETCIAAKVDYVSIEFMSIENPIMNSAEFVMHGSLLLKSASCGFSGPTRSNRFECSLMIAI
jgi:hypothetical protein